MLSGGSIGGTGDEEVDEDNSFGRLISEIRSSNVCLWNSVLAEEGFSVIFNSENGDGGVPYGGVWVKK